MTERTPRTFIAEPGVRKQTPLFVGLFAPTGGGKTFSALRLATGIQRVVGGPIFGIDTESNRMLHYADSFKFTHVPFSAPFSPDDYKDAIQYCVDKGAKTIIIDSMTHEHTGEGGVLEWHQAEMQRLAAKWECSEEKAQMAAWKEPKQSRRRLIDRILHVNANMVFCFRARKKLKIRPGKEPQELGFMPDGSEELFFEMTLSALLLSMSKGVPVWESDMPGEREMMKLPGQFAELFGKPKQLDEETGQKLAEWAAGSPPVTTQDVEDLTKAYGIVGAGDGTVFEELEGKRTKYWARLTKEQKTAVKAASDGARGKLAAQETV